MICFVLCLFRSWRVPPRLQRGGSARSIHGTRGRGQRGRGHPGSHTYAKSVVPLSKPIFTPTPPREPPPNFTKERPQTMPRPRPSKTPPSTSSKRESMDDSSVPITSAGTAQYLIKYSAQSPSTSSRGAATTAARGVTSRGGGRFTRGAQRGAQPTRGTRGRGATRGNGTRGVSRGRGRGGLASRSAHIVRTRGANRAGPTRGVARTRGVHMAARTNGLTQTTVH